MLWPPGDNEPGESRTNPQLSLQTSMAQRMMPEPPPMRPVDVLERWYATGAALYTSFACIYWFPGLPSGFLAQVKLVAFAGLILLALPRLKRPNRNQAFLLAALTTAASAAFLAVLRTSDLATAVGRARDFIEPMLWISALSSLSTAGRVIFVRRLTQFLAILLIVATYPIMAHYKLVPDLMVPAEFFTQYGARYAGFVGKVRVSSAGFSGGATGWGSPIAFATLLLASCINRAGTRWFSSLAVLFIGGFSIALIGARGASLALAISALGWILVARGSRVAGIIVLGSFTVASTLLDWRAVLPERFFKDASSSDLISRLNYISTGRITTYISGFEQFLSSPLFGVGVARATITINGEALQVHNVWLRSAVEGGLILFLPTVAIGVALLVLLASQRASDSSVSLPNARPVVIAGLIVSMFEPSTIFGAFNNNVLYWTAIWLLLEERRSAASQAQAVPEAATLSRSRPRRFRYGLQ